MNHSTDACHSCDVCAPVSFATRESRHNRSALIYVAAFAVLASSLALQGNAVAVDIAEPAAGEPIALFDGSSLDGWTTGDGQPITKTWRVDEGAIHCYERGESIYSVGEFGDFVLEFDWKVAPGGNSGVKYRVARYGKRLLGCEYQTLDDLAHKNGRNPLTSAAALYGLVAPAANKHLKPGGEYNHAKIVVRGTKFEHWLNGEKVVEVDTASDDWRRRISKSKFNDVPGFAENRQGRIMLQNHGNEAWYRNITLLPLTGDMP